MVPNDREKIIQTAQKLVDKKRYGAAIAEYQKIIQDDPGDARTLLRIGDLQARLQAYPEAIATYDRVGQHYATQGFSLKAIAVYKQIREIIKKHAPDLSDRYAHIGPRLAEIYTQLGLTSDALSAWDEIAARLQRTGRDREAVDVFRRMVELDANNPLPHLRLAEACCRVQALDDAIDSFWTAADLLLNLGRQEDALKVIERILHFRADARYARVAAELYLARNNREDGLLALAKLQICFQANPKDLDTLGLLGQAFTSIGQHDKAVEVYKEMARVAREQGRVDVFDGLMEHLRTVAPDDEQVRALALSSMPPSLSSEEVVSVEEVELEFLDEGTGRPISKEPASLPQLLVDAPVTSSPDLLNGTTPDLERERLAESGRDLDPQKALEDAESFRKLRLYPKAIGTLQAALEKNPRSIPLRDKLRAIWVEIGNREQASTEALNLATLHVEGGDLPAAEPLLLDVLRATPGHAGARALYERSFPGRILPPEVTAQPEDPNAPLLSYDLEGISAERALARPSLERSSLADDLSVGTDEPFHTDDQLPSFPQHDTESASLLPAFEEVQEISEVEELPSAPAPSSQGATRQGEMLEASLEEAEFFTARGLFDDAQAILREQLGRTPNHPLVLERLEELEQEISARDRSRTVDRSRLAHPSSNLDVSASLEALDRIELPPDSLAGRAGGRALSPADAPVDAEQVFANFKAGIRAQVTEEDSRTHFDLGIACKEMGLVSDAIRELEIAARDPTRECMCYATIGMIHLEKNQPQRAAEAYLRALSASVRTPIQELDLYYDLGNVFESLGKQQEALHYFSKLASLEPGYRDVQMRLDSLRAARGNPVREPSGARNLGDDEDLERVFEDLFESK